MPLNERKIDLRNRLCTKAHTAQNMELNAFKNLPDELIRHIMGFARPTYPYMEELKLAFEKRTQRTEEHKGSGWSVSLVYYLNSSYHKRCWIRHKLFGKYCKYWLTHSKGFSECEYHLWCVADYAASDIGGNENGYPISEGILYYIKDIVYDPNS